MKYICRSYKYDARTGTYALNIENTVEEDEIFSSKDRSDKSLVVALSILANNKLIENDIGEHMYELVDENGKTRFFTATIRGTEDDEPAATVKRIKPSKLLSSLSQKAILIQLVLAQPIPKWFVDKCNVDNHVRGTNRFLKYKKLFYQNGSEYRWKNSETDTTAIETMLQYSEYALEELYNDVTENE